MRRVKSTTFIEESASWASILAILALLAVSAAPVTIEPANLHEPPSLSLSLRPAAGLGDWKGRLPHERVVAKVRAISGKPQIAAPAGTVWSGQYDPATGRIEITDTGDEMTLTHEYGHALLHDLLRRDRSEQEAKHLFTALEGYSQDSDAQELPPWLEEAFAEFQALRPTIYGNAYYCASFNEFFAESFARYSLLDSERVPPAMRTLLASIEQSGR